MVPVTICDGRRLPRILPGFFDFDEAILFEYSLNLASSIILVRYPMPLFRVVGKTCCNHLEIGL